jgi:hypothetical protein
MPPSILGVGYKSLTSPLAPSNHIPHLSSRSALVFTSPQHALTFTPAPATLITHVHTETRVCKESKFISALERQ